MRLKHTVAVLGALMFAGSILSAQAQISYDILGNSFHVFRFTIGGGWAL